MEVLGTRNLGLALAVSVGLVACGGSGGESTSPDGGNGALDHSIEVADGRYYDCFTYTTVNRGGIDCTRISIGENGLSPEPSHNDSIAVSTEEVDGRTYDCFAYTTVKRGGLACLLVG